MSAGTAKAAAFVTNTKNGINAVLQQLDNMTKEQIALGLANPFLIPVSIRNIINLRAQAKAIIEAYSTALVSAMGGISFATTIDPRPNHPTVPGTTQPTGATTSTGSTAGTGGGTPGTTGSGTTGGGTTGGGTDTAPAGTGTPTTDPAGSAWEGGLTDYKDSDSLDGLFEVPAKTPTGGVPAHVDGGPNATPDPTGSGTKDAGHTTSGGSSAPTTTVPGTTSPDARLVRRSRQPVRQPAAAARGRYDPVADRFARPRARDRDREAADDHGRHERGHRDRQGRRRRQHRRPDPAVDDPDVAPRWRRR